MLVVAATEFELAFVAGARTLRCGIGPVEAAAATVRALAEAPTRALLHIGIAGARDLEPGTLVIGEAAIYCDLVDTASTLPRIERVVPDPRLLAAAREALPAAKVVPIATSARVGGGRACAEVEAMEGFGVLRAAATAGVPAIEVRAISNTFDAARADWDIQAAIAALAAVVPILIEAFDA